MVLIKVNDISTTNIFDCSGLLSNKDKEQIQNMEGDTSVATALEIK